MLLQSCRPTDDVSLLFDDSARTLELALKLHDQIARITKLAEKHIALAHGHDIADAGRRAHDRPLRFLAAAGFSARSSTRTEPSSSTVPRDNASSPFAARRRSVSTLATRLPRPFWSKCEIEGNLPGALGRIRTYDIRLRRTKVFREILREYRVS